MVDRLTTLNEKVEQAGINLVEARNAYNKLNNEFYKIGQKVESLKLSAKSKESVWVEKCKLRDEEKLYQLRLGK